MKVSTVRIANWRSFADTGTVELADINVIVGRNNSGKSAFVHALHLLQSGARAAGSDIRLGTGEGDIVVEFVGDSLGNDLSRRYGFPQRDDVASPTRLRKPFRRNGDGIDFMSSELDFRTNTAGVGPIPAQEPNNFIYTYLSKRKVTEFNQSVNRSSTLSVTPDLRFLVSKVARLANVDHEGAAEYAELCNKVLGFRVSTHASAQGQQAGIPISVFDYIPIEAMGEGVSSLLGLITDLCVADGNLFLIEEPENDIHPTGLKIILNVIIEKSQRNQFIISTHSNIVTRYLAAAGNSKLFAVELDYQPNTVPTSTIHEVEPTPEARMNVLRQLGYELFDFGLAEGWLILEESTAEVIIRYLVPWFVPRLARIRTIAARGTSKVEPTFEDFRRLLLFAHLEPHYRNRVWVVVDGDELGRNLVTKLQKEYGSWPASHFRAWSEGDFERYYPSQFADRVNEVLAMSHRDKREAKKRLVDEVKEWADRESDEAKAAFAVSAAEVIDVLKEIDRLLFEKATPDK